jgi:hypothetical protein
MDDDARLWRGEAVPLAAKHGALDGLHLIF